MRLKTSSVPARPCLRTPPPINHSIFVRIPLSRDAGKEDAVHAAWPVANPGNRPLGANACRASLVAILDDHDGSPVVKALSPGTRKTTFDQGRTVRSRPGWPS